MMACWGFECCLIVILRVPILGYAILVIGVLFVMLLVTNVRNPRLPFEPLLSLKHKIISFQRPNFIKFFLRL